MNRSVIGPYLGKQLIELFGLEGKRVTGINIDCRADEPVTVTVTSHVLADEADELVKLLRRYELKEPDAPDTN